MNANKRPTRRLLAFLLLVALSLWAIYSPTLREEQTLQWLRWALIFMPWLVLGEFLQRAVQQRWRPGEEWVDEGISATPEQQNAAGCLALGCALAVFSIAPYGSWACKSGGTLCPSSRWPGSEMRQCWMDGMFKVVWHFL